MSSVSSKQPPAVLYRRLLFPALPATSSPPPILPNASPAVSADAYDLLALALRAYISPWWSKLSRYDRDFIPHVSLLLLASLRVLSARIQRAHTLSNATPRLLFHVLPLLLAQHYADFRAARAKLGSSYALGGAASIEKMFHAQQAHMAVILDEDDAGAADAGVGVGVGVGAKIDAEYIRHMIDRILYATLPPEDYASDAERAIVKEVLVKVVLVDIVPLLVQPWFVHKTLLDVLRLTGDKPSPPKVRVFPLTSPAQS